ncbi:MAG: DUF4198 domain-containing protein [Pseudomonadota bacterium]
MPTQPPHSPPHQRLRKARGALLLSLLLTEATFAHDFLIWPDAFITSTNIEARFRVGHSGQFDPWPHGLTHVEVLTHYRPDSKQHALANKTESGVRVDAAMRGTHMIALTSRWSKSELPAQRFNDYVAKEGLQEIALHRTRNRLEDSVGKERYSRRAKTLIQNGDAFDTYVTQPIGQTLEIVPAVNPYALGTGESLPITVLYQAKPLASATVKIENLTISGVGVVEALSDAAGQVALPFARHGDWKVTVVWGVPTDDAETIYETIFASLTFGFTDSANTVARSTLE